MSRGRRIMVRVKTWMLILAVLLIVLIVLIVFIAAVSTRRTVTTHQAWSAMSMSVGEAIKSARDMAEAEMRK